MMSTSKAIYEIAKEMGIDSNRIILACKTLNIYAKASSKRLNKNQIEMISKHFKSGKNVANEIIEINNTKSINKKINQEKLTKHKKNDYYFPNRLISQKIIRIYKIKNHDIDIFLDKIELKYSLWN